MSESPDHESLEGVIEEIMEVFPLRLLVRTTSGMQYVQLEEDTELVSHKKPADARDLAAGRSVYVLGMSSGNLFIAREITIE
jgi:hypothetical protein